MGTIIEFIKNHKKIIMSIIISLIPIVIAAIISTILFKTSIKLKEVIAWNEITCCKAVCLSAIICVCIICITVIACLLISALKSNKTQSSDSGAAMKEAYKEIFGKCKDENAIIKDATQDQNTTDTKNTPTP